MQLQSHSEVIGDRFLLLIIGDVMYFTIEIKGNDISFTGIDANAS